MNDFVWRWGEAEQADADMRHAPPRRFDDRLDHRRPDGAGEIIARGRNPDGKPAPLREPLRHVGQERTEGRGASDADEEAMGDGDEPQGRCEARTHIAEAETHAGDDDRRDDAEPIDQPAHRPSR